MVTTTCRISLAALFLLLLALPMTASAQENADWSGALAAMGVSLSGAPASLPLGASVAGTVADKDKLLASGYLGQVNNGDAVTVINQGNWTVSITNSATGQNFITTIPEQFRQ